MNAIFQIYAYSALLWCTDFPFGVQISLKNREALQNPWRQTDDTKQVHTEDPQILEPPSEIVPEKLTAAQRV